MRAVITQKLLHNQDVIVDDKWFGTEEFILNTEIVSIDCKQEIASRIDSNKTFQKLHAQSMTWVIKAHLSPFEYNNLAILQTTCMGVILLEKRLLRLFCYFSNLEFRTNRDWVKILQCGETLGFVKCAPFLLKERKKSYDFLGDFARFKLNA